MQYPDGLFLVTLHSIPSLFELILERFGLFGRHRRWRHRLLLVYQRERVSEISIPQPCDISEDIMRMGSLWIQCQRWLLVLVRDPSEHPALVHGEAPCPGKEGGQEIKRVRRQACAVECAEGVRGQVAGGELEQCR